MTTRGEIVKAVEVSDEQRDTKVYKHPDRETIHALLLRGKPSKWIAAWLAQRYPTEDQDGMPHERAEQNEKLRISERALNTYRRKFYPETGDEVEGVVHEELERLIGYRLPAPTGHAFELDLLETVGIHAAQEILERAMKTDAEMGMLNPVTLDAHSRLVDVLARSIELKSKLGRSGYEAVPERQHIVSENSHFSVELSGRINARTGESEPVQPERLELVRDLLQASPEERAQILAAARELSPPATEVIEAQPIEQSTEGTTNA